MNAVRLTRIDASQNMQRFYALTVQPTLFGEWALVKEWGRIGRAGHIESAAYTTRGAADLALAQEFKRKVRDGYVSISRPCDAPPKGYKPSPRCPAITRGSNTHKHGNLGS